MTLLDRDAIIRYLHELATELPDGAQEEIVIVGGSMLACRGLRNATHDIDTARRISAQLGGAAARVADRHPEDLERRWLNDAAVAFVPSTDIVDVVDSDPILELGTLTVFTATPDAVFLMKLAAQRPQDLPDLETLWPLCSFESPEAAAHAYNGAYALLGGHDEHMLDTIRSIAARAGRR